ncbi:MAG: hypothetical protein KME60_04595 [Cyanomargarita calcarea GSE-NOS-MK-12-04C]|jgi:hypothetical protein|uniref:Uncharacterized protein n=1 Tax=Cyanomargarita calcarea GSE-NOS-MK-12-04C TaxID=2839659 RepID=A0A951QIX5_9CYAN|nr:hypothetical protein [Cyanomargarita calcarea GSE-NOS-MK-12-04C]
MNHREELLKLIELLDEKIFDLEKSKIREANPLVLFQLRKAIEEAETERQVLNWETTIFMKLPAINPFCEGELNDWLDIVEMEFDELPFTDDFKVLARWIWD